MPDECVFCRIIRGDEPATVVHRWADAMAIVPLNPVTPGHLLVIPVQHTRDITEDAWVSAMAMRRAAEVAQAPCNIITSAGTEATQTVPHLHVHVVPRAAGDGLALPWTGQADAEVARAAGWVSLDEATRRAAEREIQTRVNVAEEIAAAIRERLDAAKTDHRRKAYQIAEEIALTHRLPPGAFDEEVAVELVEPRKLDTAISVRLDSELVARLRDIATRRECSVSDLLREGAELTLGAVSAVGLVPLSDVLAALRDAKAWDQWIGLHWESGWPADVRPEQARIAADYLAERFGGDGG